MALGVFILVFFSAAIHVFWNTSVKTSRDKVSFVWLTAVAATAVLAPVFVVARIVQPGPLSWEVVALAALSGLCEAAYIIPLFLAYDRADLSVVYPLSRGVAPLVTLSLGGVLLGDAVTVRHGAAVLVVVLGVGGVSWSAWAAAPHRHTLAGVGLALWAGCLIAGYHLVDRRAMTLQKTPGPIEYLFLMHCFMLLFISAWVAVSARRRARAMNEWPANRRGVLIVGVGAPLAYLLIVLALRHGNVTYVTAGRNVGIVISTLVGGLFLAETVGWRRTVGAVLIAAGVAALVLLS
jgi:drug/metabolite transporter (DMT)-like permease